MRTLLCAVLFLAFTVSSMTACDAAGPAKSKPLPAKTADDAFKFTRLSVKDPEIHNREAFSLLIPAGWKAEGGVQWLTDYFRLANLLIKITDPGTGAAIEFLPSMDFSWLRTVSYPPGTNYMGNTIWPPIQDPQEFVQTMYVPGPLARLNGARMLKKEDFPKVSAEMSRFHGTQARFSRVRYEYQDGGQAWDEDVYVTLLYSQSPIGIYWSGMAHSFRAPRGQLDRLTPIMNTTINTNRPSQEWFGYYMYVRNLFLDRMNQGIRNAGRISDTITRNTAEIGKMFEDSYRKSNESQDRISRNYSEYVRGVETYRNPYEDRPIQLPSGYDGVWVSRSGEYLLSNQPGFDPNAGSATEWRRMERGR